MNYFHAFGHVFVPYVVTASAVFGIICCLLVFALVRYRSSRRHAASQKSQHKVAESIYAGFLVLVAAALIFFAGQANAAERHPLGKPQMKIAIVAFQWCWSFHYAGTPVTVTGNCNPTVPTLVVPTGKVILFSLESHDVVHEWWVPGMRYKEEAFPQHENVFEARYTAPGTYTGRCSEFCGLYHYRMEFKVKVESEKAFAQWLASREHAR